MMHSQRPKSALLYCSLTWHFIADLASSPPHWIGRHAIAYLSALIAKPRSSRCLREKVENIMLVNQTSTVTCCHVGRVACLQNAVQKRSQRCGHSQLRLLEMVDRKATDNARSRGQLVTCKAGPSNRQPAAQSPSFVVVPESMQESVSIH